MRIGVDLGGTGIQAGVVDSSGQIVARAAAVTRQGAAAVIADIISICKELVAQVSAVEAIGIGCPGPVHPPSGTVVRMPNIEGFENIALASIVSDELKLPVFISNDANSAALAEHKFGAARGSKNSVTITLGTGVGGGIIINDEVYAGTFFGAGELGHLIIRMGGELCGCGQLGCLEAYASASSLIREASEIATADWGGITAKTVFERADAGNEQAKKIVDDYFDNLCAGIISIICILQPEAVVIGGGISKRGQPLLDEIKLRLSKAMPVNGLETKIVLADLGTDAGIIGAALVG